MACLTLIRPRLFSTSRTAIDDAADLRPLNSLRSLALLGCVDAVSLLALHQALKEASFQASFLIIVTVQVILPLMREAVDHPLSALKLGHLAILVGVVTLSMKTALGLKEYGTQSTTFHAATSAVVHSATNIAGRAIRDSLISTEMPGNISKFPSPLLIQAWSGVFATACTIVACGTSSLFAKREITQAPIHFSSEMQYEILVLSVAFGLSTVALTCITKEKAHTLQIARLCSIFLNSVIYGYFRSTGAFGWLGIGWIMAGLCFLDIPLNLRSAYATPEAFHNDTEQKQPQFGSIAFETTESIEHYPLQSSSASSTMKQRLSSASSMLLWPIAIVLAGLYIQHGLSPSSSQYSLSNLAASQAQGGQWANTILQALRLECPHEHDAARYERRHLKTALASFPRSGNSWTRNLIERSVLSW